MRTSPPQEQPLQNPQEIPQHRGEVEEEENEQSKNQSSSPAHHDQEEERARCEWDFNLSVTISSSSAVSDAIGVVEFDETNRFLATGGIARKIRIYDSDKFPQNDDETHAATSLDHSNACDFYICTPAKLSGLKWKPGSGSRVIGSADYDGVVTEYDLETRVPVFERDEHSGRRVWCMDYGHRDLNLGASGSDDGTMQLWDSRCGGDALVRRVRPNLAASSAVCCVEFDPFCGPGVILGCADRVIYSYDARMMAGPVFTLEGHGRAVTYTKFLDEETVVSSSIDGCLMTWHVGGDRRRLVRTYRGHVNSRRFVGLSVWGGGGLLSCGSEDNRVFVYDRRRGEPIWARGLEPAGRKSTRGEPGFVSSVCWRSRSGGGGEDRCTLVAAGGSDGVLQVFEGERKSRSS